MSKYAVNNVDLVRFQNCDGQPKMFQNSCYIDTNTSKKEQPISHVLEKKGDSKSLTSDGKNEIDTDSDNWKLLYKVSESPSFPMTLLFGFQQTLMGLPFCVISAIMVAQAVCADHDNELKTKLLSTTIFLSAITTFLQTTFGVRLPVYQGPTPVYIVPLLVVSALPDWKCQKLSYITYYNSTSGENVTTDEIDIYGYRENIVYPKLRMMQGSLICAGTIHMLIGLTGFVGVLVKVVGPLTVIPTLLLIGIELYTVMNTFCEPHWGISGGTFIVSIVFAVYLNGWNMPLPMYSREKKFHVIRYPIQQVLAILFAILLGWAVSGILTYAGALSSDPRSKEYKARTDAGSDTIRTSEWFTVPYPTQFGSIEFNSGIFITYIIATLLSIVESIADYYACAKLSHLPPPPLPAINRGIMMEGFMSMIAGFFGAGHATTTYSNNIGLIGMTKVASRRVFQMLAVQLIIFAVIGKIGAVFVAIPYPVLGGAGILSFGIFLGIFMSYLQYTDMNSPRNLAVVGVSMLTGLMVPNWVSENSQAINTGNQEFDKFLLMSLTNPSLFGGLLAFLLDNTVKGTRKERGLTIWDKDESVSSDTTYIEEDEEVYEIPILTKYLSFLNFLPVFPTYTQIDCKCRNNKKATENKIEQK